jgi:Lar family restriction alleviation protein
MTTAGSRGQGAGKEGGEDKMADEAKECPFCGEKVATVDTLIFNKTGKAGRFRIQCRECGVNTRCYEDAEEAWKAWNSRRVKMCNEMAAFIVNQDLFIYNALAYMRNKQSGYCFAQKTFRGPLKRIKKSDFLSAAQSAAIARAEQANTEYERTTGKVKACR